MRIHPHLLLLFALAARPTIAETIVLRGAAQGTTYHIKFVQPLKAVDATKLQADIDRVLSEIDRQMSTYRDDSEISRFNQAPAEKWFEVSPAVMSVVKAARTISEKTDGAMDITVGPLVRLWHFGPRNPSDKTKKLKFEPPTDEQLSAARMRIGYKLLEVRENPPALKKSAEGLEIDLSSIAPGWTIDRLAELLVDRGIKDFMVELGGEVRASGDREDGSPWRVAIERPTVGQREMEMAVPLVNAALATAGGTQKFFEYDGKRYSHIINPATGQPVTHTLASVTVAANSCLQADGWDTPLLVLGPERGVKVADANGIAAMFVVRPEKGDGDDVVKTTAAWQKRFGKKR
jgi:thiamine biosynthesis lipoprotein